METNKQESDNQESPQMSPINAHEQIINPNDIVMINKIPVKKRRMISKTGTSLSNGVSMNFEFAFGSYQNLIRKHSFFLGEDDLVYLCGKHIVTYNILRKKQNFILKNIEDEVIMSMNYYYKNKSSIKIAVALKSQNNILPMVKIYNPNKNFTFNLVHSHLSIEVNIIDLIFLYNGRYLVSLAQKEEGSLHTLTLWIPDKEECLMSEDIHKDVTQLETGNYVQDNESFLFSLAGKNYLGLWSLNRSTKQITSINEKLYTSCGIQGNITSHCWSREGGKIIVAAEMAIYIIKDMILEEKIIITVPLELVSKTEQDEMLNVYISAVTSRRKGICVGLGGLPILVVYKLNLQGKMALSGNFRVRNEQCTKIADMNSSTDDMYLAMTVKTQLKSMNRTSQREEDNYESSNASQMLQGNLEIYTFNFASVEASKQQMKDPFEPIFEKGVHYSRINGLSLCPTKPLLATVSDDFQLKIWDIQSEERQKGSFPLHEKPLCVDLHPLSIQIAVGFKDGFHVYYLLDDTIQWSFKINGKTCSALKYSEMGHYLAVGLNNFVYIYDTYEMKIIKSEIKGHNDCLKEFQWFDNDSRLLSHCHKSIVYVWNEENWEKDFEYIKNFKFHAVAYDSEYDLLVICCGDCKLRICEEKGLTDLMEYDISPNYFTCVQINKKFKVIFLGTDVGSVKVYLWPFLDFKKEQIECLEVAVHQGPVRHITTTFDYVYLVTSSDDGSIFVSRLKEFIDGEDVSNLDLFNVLSKGKEIEMLGKISNTYNFANFCLVSKNGEKKKINDVKELKSKLDTLKSDLDEKKEELCNKCNEEILELERNNKKKLDLHKQSLAIVMEESDTNLRNLISNIDNSKANFEKTLDSLDTHYQTNLLDLYRENRLLEEDMLNYKTRMEEDIVKIHKESKKVLEGITQEYQQKYDELYNRYKVAVFNLKIDQKKFEEALMQTEIEYDVDLKKTKTDYEEKLKKHQEFAEKTRTENGKLKKENEKHKERDANLKNLIKETKNQNKQLSEEIDMHKEKMKIMASQLEERSKLILEKETAIKDLRTKNQHLQNFKSVYDHRVVTLKEESIPLNDYYESLEKHISSLYKELLSEAEANKKLKNHLDDLDSTVNNLKKEIITRDDMLRNTKRKLQNFEYQTNQIIIQREKHQDPIKESIEKLLEESEAYLTHIEGTLARANNVFVTSMIESREAYNLDKLTSIESKAIKDELIRLRDFLSKKLQNTTSVNNKMEKERDYVYKKIQNDGKLLIKKCNELRTDKMDIKYKLGTYQKRAKELNGAVTDSLEKLNENQRIYQSNYSKAVGEEKSITFTPAKEAKQINKDTDMQLPLELYKKNSLQRQFRSDILAFNKQEPSQQNILNVMMQEAKKFYDESSKKGFKNTDELQKKLKSIIFQKDAEGGFLFFDEPDETHSLAAVKIQSESKPKKLKPLPGALKKNEKSQKSQKNQKPKINN